DTSRALMVFWRARALLMICIDHRPETVFQHVTQKNFGFSDAAELFVFLSGARREGVIAFPVVLVRHDHAARGQDPENLRSMTVTGGRPAWAPAVQQSTTGGSHH